MCTLKVSGPSRHHAPCDRLVLPSSSLKTVGTLYNMGQRLVSVCVSAIKQHHARSRRSDSVLCAQREVRSQHIRLLLTSTHRSVVAAVATLALKPTIEHKIHRVEAGKQGCLALAHTDTLRLRWKRVCRANAMGQASTGSNLPSG